MSDFDRPTTRIDVIRHAECEGGAIFRGTTDVPLSEAGWARLRRVTAPLSGWQAIVTSPMRRCREFAEELAADRDLPLAVDERFREMSFGDWEGVLASEIWAEQPQRAKACYLDPHHNLPPGGEPLPAVRSRVAAGWADLIATHREQHVLLIAHGGVMRSLIAYVLDMPLSASNRFGMPYGCRLRFDVLHFEDASVTQLTGLNLDQA